MVFTMLLVLAGAAPAFAVPSKPPAQIGTLSGTVHDHLGVPLRGATVTLYQYVDPDNIGWWVWEPVVSTTTGRNGSYSFA